MLSRTLPKPGETYEAMAGLFCIIIERLGLIDNLSVQSGQSDRIDVRLGTKPCDCAAIVKNGKSFCSDNQQRFCKYYTNQRDP